MDEIEEAIEEAKAQVGEHFTVKQLEKLRKSLKQKLEKLQGTDRKDDVVIPKRPADIVDEDKRTRYTEDGSGIRSNP